MTETVSIKLSVSEKARLRAVADARKVSVSTLLLEGLERVLADERETASPSCYDLTARYFEDGSHLGSSGLGDLSTNKTRLRNLGRK